MPGKIIIKRTRFFFAVEGESEQSFVKWLQHISQENNLHTHHDYYALCGGGFKTMLDRALAYRKKGLSKGAYKDSFLIVDADRADHGDWSLPSLRQKAAENGLTLIAQRPNFEGLLVRMIPGYEHLIPGSPTLNQLRTHFKEYRKPADANWLRQKYSLDDLLRVSGHDVDCRTLLKAIGLIR